MGSSTRFIKSQDLPLTRPYTTNRATAPSTEAIQPALSPYLGGIEVLSNVLVSLMSAKSAAAVMGLTSGVMSWFSSSSGVVMPTLLPTVPHVAQQLGGVNEFELASSITTISHVAAISPLSTGGALALAAYASAANANQKQQQNLFMKMFGVSALGVSVLCVFSYFGMFHWLL